MRCAYLTTTPTENDQNAWSGTIWHIRQALIQAGYGVEHIGSLVPKCPLGPRLKSHYYRTVGKRVFDLDRNGAYRKAAAQATARRIAEAGDFDFLFAPSSFPITGLDQRIPKFIWLDGGFRLLANKS
jgi:hypothetical protein